MPETSGETTLLHLLPSLEVSRVFLLLTASPTEKYLQAAASCQENLLQTLKTRGICSYLDPCECLWLVCVCVCVCSKLWRANKHILSPQKRSTLFSHAIVVIVFLLLIMLAKYEGVYHTLSSPSS